MAMSDPEHHLNYQYGTLSKGHIRILYLHPGQLGDTVLAEISTEKLIDGIEDYVALSWQWGNQKASENIFIKNKESKENVFLCLEVKLNLLAALKCLRRRNETVRLWVDAICIKQVKENNSEKSDQISMMTKIYGSAKEVWVWLGEARDDSAKAIRFIDNLVNLQDVNHISGLERSAFDQSIANGLDPLIKLLKREWFSRRWVVQEIAMARRATVHCGKDTVDWNKLADAVALLEKVGRDGTINRIFKRLPATNHASEYIGNISSIPAYRLVQNTTGMFHGQDKEGGIRIWRYTLEELVSFLAAFRASRLHDTIYALLGLASDVSPGSNTQSVVSSDTNLVPHSGLKRRGTMRKAQNMTYFEVNYQTPPLVVFKMFLNIAIKKSESLDIICRPWAPSKGIDADDQPQEIKLPSWIPSLSRKPFQPTVHGNMVRYNPDPLVGPAGGRKVYNASGSDAPIWKITNFNDLALNRLSVGGFVLGEIGKIWDSGAFGNVPAEWLTAGGWTDETKTPPDELWRTLVADRNAHGDDPDRWYPMAFQSAVRERGISYGLETHRLIHESTNATVSELFRRVQSVVWNRKLIRVKGEFMLWLTRNFKEKAEERQEMNGIAEVEEEVVEEEVVEEEFEDGEVEDEEVENEKEASEQEEGEDPEALGLAPNSARKGDLVCIIYGCSVPLVLRSVRQPKQPASGLRGDRQTSADTSGANPRSSGSAQDAEEIYSLIGECYIGHMMDSEAITYAEEKKPKIRKFILE